MSEVCPHCGNERPFAPDVVSRFSEGDARFPEDLFGFVALSSDSGWNPVRPNIFRLHLGRGLTEKKCFECCRTYGRERISG